MVKLNSEKLKNVGLTPGFRKQIANQQCLHFILDYELLTKMIEDEVNFLEVKALGEDLAWRVIKLWMQSAGRDLNNYQVTSLRDGIELSLPC